MGKRDINPDHRSAFLGVLAEVEQFVPLDRDNFRPLLEVREYAAGKTMLMLAVPVALAERCRPFHPCVALIGPPHYLSKKSAVFEFALQDTRGQPNGDMPFPIALAVLPNGRRILTIYGLTLDTAGERSSFQRGTLEEDKAQFVGQPKVMEIVTKLIETFPISPDDSKSEGYRKRALAELKWN